MCRRSGLRRRSRAVAADRALDLDRGLAVTLGAGGGTRAGVVVADIDPPFDCAVPHPSGIPSRPLPAGRHLSGRTDGALADLTRRHRRGEKCGARERREQHGDERCAPRALTRRQYPSALRDSPSNETTTIVKSLLDRHGVFRS